MLKVALVGCGKIADDHASQIKKLKGCEIVGVCDREPLMARQLYERFPVRRYFSDLSQLLHEARPDVVHVTTPPQSHFQIARTCLEHGANVYVEKPFTLNTKDAQTLVALAEERGLRLTAGHDDQFSPVARRMRTLINSGYLGGDPVHMESYFCYDLSDPAYARALLNDKRHWVRRLPGKLLQNIISHGVARIAEFLPTDAPRVIAHGFVSPFLGNMGEEELIDELRVIICGEKRTTAYFTFSSQMRPLLHQFRIYGPQNGVVVDQDQETLIKLRGQKYKSYLEKFAPPVGFALQFLGNLTTNVKGFMGRDLHMKSGMQCLIESFYNSIVQNTPPPIPYREIVLTARIMDAIFEQLDARQSLQVRDSRILGVMPLQAHLQEN
ncbi:MAG TPA: Gfo/Idh/MocA family oxidoreductase [Terriglobales bacterium]|jgi:predicted dehydrogenase|nr:Gfo/Idh/MocA family oxidoreductase [Terriglobales bacterium]